MGCKHRKYEMSLSLDGRLPSGRRTELLRHVAECTDCAAEWEGMRKAQDLALRLPTRNVSPRFRADLQRRIESGEGAPDAVYRYPISTMSRVRLVGIGAAAAALLITAINWFTPSERPHSAPASVAKSETIPLAPRHAPYVPLANDLEPVSEFGLARMGAQTCAASSNELRARLRSFGETPREEETWPAVRGVVFNLKVAVNVMHWLNRKNMMELPSDLEDKLQEVDESLRLVFGGGSWETRWSALRRVQNVDLGGLNTNLMIKCCKSSDDLLSDVGDLVQHIPEATIVFRIVGVDDSGAIQKRLLEPGGGKARRVFFLQQSTHR